MKNILNYNDSMKSRGNARMKGLIAALLVIVVAGGFIGTFFSTFNSSNVGINAPAWFSGSAISVIAAGVLWTIYRAIIAGR